MDCAPDVVSARLTDLLLRMYTRLADRYVAAGMRMGAPQHLVDRCAWLVLLLDGVTEARTLDQRTAIGAIRADGPAMYHLIGKASWSGYAQRKAEYDMLRDLGALIVGGGHEAAAFLEGTGETPVDLLTIKPAA